MHMVFGVDTVWQEKLKSPTITHWLEKKSGWGLCL